MASASVVVSHCGTTRGRAASAPVIAGRPWEVASRASAHPASPTPASDQSCSAASVGIPAGSGAASAGRRMRWVRYRGALCTCADGVEVGQEPGDQIDALAVVAGGAGDAPLAEVVDEDVAAAGLGARLEDVDGGAGRDGDRHPHDRCDEGGGDDPGAHVYVHRRHGRRGPGPGRGARQ